MKHLRLLLPLLLLFFVSCEKINDLLTFEITSSDTIKIPASGLINTPIVAPVPVPVNSQQTFENNNTKAELVRDVRLVKLTLTIVDPAAENFNFLNNIKIYIGTSGDDKVLLASLDKVPTGVSTIELVSGNGQLDKYLKAPSYTLYTEVGLRANVARELTVQADSRFKVTADPL
jgi:hypothetical protein